MPSRTLPQSSSPGETPNPQWVEMHVEAFGVGLGIRSCGKSGLQAMARLLPPGSFPTPPSESTCWFVLESQECDSGPAVHVVRRGELELARSADLSYVLRVLEFHLTSRVLEESSERLFVHAGAVAWKGQGILLPGDSLSGKSRLVAALIQAGAEYYSDEFAPLDRHGYLHPYAKPVSLREGRSLIQTDYPVEHFGGRAGTGSLKVALVVFSPYREGASFRPRRLSRGRGTLYLLPHASGKRRDTRRVFDTLQNLQPGHGFWESARGEASEAARQILEMAG